MASSGYAAITFVANEQPTTAKWNLIGSNDSSFNLGTGFEDGVIVARHYAANSIGNAAIAAAAIGLGDAVSASGEAGTGVWGAYADVPTVQCSVTTTKANQKLLMLCRLNGYSGGVTNYRFVVDGTAAGNPGKINWGTTAATTTESRTFMDVITIATAGAHTIKVQLLQGASSLRVINAEGSGEIVALHL